MTHVLLVTGSREWTDWHRLSAVLRTERKAHSDLVVRHGKAQRGADFMAAQWCEENKVPQDPVEAEWHALGKVAGFARNTVMVEKEPKPYRCHAFFTPYCPGTTDCAKKARKAQIEVVPHR